VAEELLSYLELNWLQRGVSLVRNSREAQDT
jgi:hypothetical protein